MNTTKMSSPLSLAATIAVMSVTLQAQTASSPQISSPSTTAATQSAPQAAQAPVQAASLTAELTKSIDTKKAKVGDEVSAKTTDDAKLPDGTALPKGTKLVGNVVDVTAKTKDQKNAHLVLALNRAVTKDGRQMPIRAAVTSMTAPNAANSGMDTASSGGGMSAPSGGASTGTGAGGSSSGAAAAPTPSAPTMSDSGPAGQPTQGQMLKSAQDRVAVGNMPKVMLSAPTTADSAGVLDAEGQNISLDSGTKLTLNVIPAQPGTQGQ